MQSLYTRLLLTVVVIFVAVAVLVVYVSRQLTTDYQNEVQQRLHRELSHHIIHDTSIIVDGVLNPDGLETAFHNMMILGPAFEFYLLDADGKIIQHAAKPPSKVKRTHVSLDPIRDYLAGNPAPVFGDDPRGLTRQKIFSVAPIEKPGGNLYLYIIIAGEEYDSVTALVGDSHSMRLASWALFAGLGATLLLSIGLVTQFTRPLRSLRDDINAFRADGFTTGTVPDNQWDPRSGDEVHELGTAFHEMAESVQTQYQKVRTTEELRRELLSYISHDLRTPLASLEGYLETWQIKEAETASESGRHYIQTARKNAQQVAGLVEQLFELANLDSGNVTMHMEAVAIAEFAQDVIQKFQLDADERNIRLDVAPQDPSLRVDADLEKLERVFTNLVDNALRHCTAGDEVAIKFRQEASVVCVEVVDTGSGIPEGELTQIFEPHYRATNARRQGPNSGLGLAITRRLLELHEATIEVSSELKQGTTFSFSLAAI